MDRQTFVSIIPLVAIAIALAEFLLDRQQPRWQSPFFWISLVATVGLLIAVQVLRFVVTTPRTPPAKPDYSATSIVRRSSKIE